MRNHLINQQREQLHGLIQQRDKLNERAEKLQQQHQALEQARRGLAGVPAAASPVSLLNQGLIRQQLNTVIDGHRRQLAAAQQDSERLQRLSRQQAGKVKGLELLEQRRADTARRDAQRREWEAQLEWCCRTVRHV
ncbi:hypothetical protein GU3_14050 [Oceanimonas sp. GK1]|uniref:hypothetical protein n=1 Tax=Oceanimonas sp. (strain GK1 / IBRC-M 10197) TaxID=511062 RepID=UPI0002495694|nr:hypothetical protein [Oceanimonas sp. GK1]AEY02563.1 hypothetical protein GU3_14050 [Oceanimonas sp. GK1]